MKPYRPCALVRWWQRLTAPVPQDTGAIMYAEYRGKVVMLVPVMSAVRPWLVQKWIPDPDQTKAVDAMVGVEAARRTEETDDAEAGRPPDLEAQTEQTGLNPAAVTGL